MKAMEVKGGNHPEGSALEGFGQAADKPPMTRSD